MGTIWSDLKAHRKRTADVRIIDLLEDAERFDDFSVTCGEMLLDFSKTSIDKPALHMLLKMASEVEVKRDAMFRGDKINSTEDRAVLHTALRKRDDKPIFVEGNDIMPGVRANLARMTDFANAIRSGQIPASDGQPFTDIINIGIGGSDLGPAMTTLALAPFHDGPRTHFISNVDGAHAHDTLKSLDPSRTLVIIASKTFTTIETMTNANTVLLWLQDSLGNDASKHLVAISTAEDKTSAYGIPSERTFGFEDWVGGRYSVWGPIGLSLMLAIGPENFVDFLSGAFDMDQHFLETPLAENMPVLLGLIGVWHNNICGYPTRAILPYDQRLSRLPAYLQQLDMESNGKSVSISGEPLAQNSGPVIWGEPGTNGQHAFYQLIHQGTSIVPCEFMIAAEGFEPDLRNHHNLLIANCLAQSEALMLGRSLDKAPDAQRVFPGNRPSTTLMYRQLTPKTLGMIVALYEHRVFVEGVIWGINSFDQWGVELGKELATKMLPFVKENKGLEDVNFSTVGLINKLRSLRKP